MEPQSGGLQLSYVFFKVKLPTRIPIGLKLPQNIAKYMNPYHQPVISSKVNVCTSQPVAFNGHPSTGRCQTGLRNKLQQKQTWQHLAVVYWQLVSLLMELSIDGENCSLTWRV